MVNRIRTHYSCCSMCVQAARKGFKKVVCFESSPVNYEATKAAVKENNVSLPSPLSPFVTAGKR